MPIFQKTSNDGQSLMPDCERMFNFKKHQVWAENLTLIMQIGLTMAGCIIFCFFVGRYLDRWLGTKGVFVIIFTILGIFGGANTVYRQIIAATEDKTKNGNNTDNGAS